MTQKAFKAMGQKSFDEIEPLRANSSEEEDSIEYVKGWHNPQSMQGRPFLSLRNFLVIQLGVFALYSLGLFVVVGKQGANCKNAPGLMYSPALGAIQMQRQVLHNSLGTMNPFKGPPGPEQVEAWESLLTNTNIRLTAEEVERMNVTSVQLADGSGDYLASLDVYHELHCVVSFSCHASTAGHADNNNRNTYTIISTATTTMNQPLSQQRCTSTTAWTRSASSSCAAPM